MKILINRAVKPVISEVYESYEEVYQFHRKMPGYKPAPLHQKTESAVKYGVGNILIKEESLRFGLPAFKILGASYAVWKIIEERFGIELSDWSDTGELRNVLLRFPQLKFVSATDGNHGRGVARMGKLLGYKTKIFMPEGTAQARIKAIESEGAEVVIVDGNYDLAVSEAAKQSNENNLLVQDTSWKGYQKINNWIIAGYSTMFKEIDDTIVEKGLKPPDVVFIQIGVGSLAAAVVKHFKSNEWGRDVKIIGVEPLGADCAYKAIKAGEIITLESDQHSMMAGLNCGTVASAAWDYLREGIDCFLAIEDEYSVRAMRELHNSGIDTSESGAAGYGGLMALMESQPADAAPGIPELNAKTSILIIITEGITDLDSWNNIIGESQ